MEAENVNLDEEVPSLDFPSLFPKNEPLEFSPLLFSGGSAQSSPSPPPQSSSTSTSPTKNLKDVKGQGSSGTKKVPPVARKKRQKPTVSSACKECRSKHAKCDGLNPCSNCVKKETACVYDAFRKKRGPAPGKVKQLEHVITLLAKEINKPNDNENQLCLSSMFGTYVDSYNTILYPLIGIPPLFRDFADLQEASNEEKAYMYSILANGSMAFGNHSQVENFLASARSLIVDIFDHSDMKIAATYSLMGLCLVSRGYIDQGRNCNALALSICKNLKNKDIKDPLLDTVYRGCLVGVAELCESKHEQWATLDQALAELGEYKHIESFKIQIFSTLVAKILLMCAQSDIENVPETFGLLEEAEQCVPDQSPLRLQVKTILTSVRGLLYFLSGMQEAAIECVREVDVTLSQVPPIYWFPGLLLAALLVIQIRLVYDLPIIEDVQRLRKTGENYPIASLIAAQILDPNCTKYIHFIPVIPSLGFARSKHQNLVLNEELANELVNGTQFETAIMDPMDSKKESHTPTQVTIWYQMESQQQTYRITPTTTIGDLIEQTPVANHSQFMLLDGRGSLLPRNAYIVQLFKETCPVLQLKRIQTWE